METYSWIAVFAPSLLLRATALLAGALAISIVLRGAAGAWRHALWTASLVGLLLLPALMAVGPTVAVPLPAWPLADAG